MARTKKEPLAPADMPEILPERAVAIVESQETLALQTSEAATRTRALADELGYEGSLDVAALEDGIRFYQRRTVEAILETGKRLLILRDLSQIGTEFDKRAEALGLSRSTAYRFMQAAVKTAKSANLKALSSEVKSASAFLELVTHDEDELKALSDLDDIDRMSATQLRAALRQAKEDNDYAGEQIQKERTRADKAEKKLRGKVPEVMPLDERITPFTLEIAERQSLLEKALAAHLESIAALEAWWTSELEGNEDGAEMPQSIKLVLINLDDAVNRTASMVGSLQNELEMRFGSDIQSARQYIMSTGERG